MAGSSPFSQEEAQRKISNKPRVRQVFVVTHCCSFSPFQTLAIAHLFHPFETYILKHWKKTFRRLISKRAPDFFVLVFCFCFVFQEDKVFLCRHDCPGTHSVDRLALNSQRFVCLCLPSAGIKGVCHYCLAVKNNLKTCEK